MKVRRAIGIAVAFLCTAGPANAQVDFTGQWAPLYHEDTIERIPGPELGDYTGLPLSEAGRMRADSWDADRISVVQEYQCRPHSADYSLRGLAPLRIWADYDPATQRIVAFHTHIGAYENKRTIYLDGRQHPNEYAPHTFQGFSTGVWEGNMLTVTTTHLKEYIIRRDGVPVSDRTTMIEHWMRHGDFLTIVQIITDPVYLTEPFIQTTDFVLDLGIVDAPELCEVEEEADHPKGWVPHRLPGASKEEEEFAKKHGLPIEAVRGGAETMYPDYRAKLKQAK